MKKFLSLLLALTLALSIALPAATASADGVVQGTVITDITKPEPQAWASLDPDYFSVQQSIPEYPALSAGNFLIVKFTKSQMPGNYNTSAEASLVINVNTEFAGIITAYVGQCGCFTGPNNDEAPNGVWTPILRISQSPVLPQVSLQAGDKIIDNLAYYAPGSNFDFTTGESDDDYLAFGVSLQGLADIKKDVTVTISLKYGDTVIGSGSHKFTASSASSSDPGSTDKSITITSTGSTGEDRDPYLTEAIITQEEADLPEFTTIRLKASTSGFGDVSGLTWSSTNSEVVSVEQDASEPLQAVITIHKFGEAYITASIGDVTSNTYHVWVRPPLHTVVGLTYEKGAADANGVVPVYVKSGEQTLATVKVTAQLTDGDGYINSNDTASVDHFEILELVKNLVEDKHSIGYDESTLKLVEIGAEKVTESSDTVILTNIGPYMYLNFKENEYNYGYTVAAEYLTSGAYSNRNIRVKAPDGAQAVDIKQEWTAGSETSKNVAVSEGYAAIDNVKPYASLRVTKFTGEESSQTQISWKDQCWIYGQNLDLLSSIIHQTYLFVPSSLYNDGLYVTVSFNNSVKTYYLKNLQKSVITEGAYYIIPQEAFAYQMGKSITIDLFNYDGTAKTLYIAKQGDDGHTQLWTLDGGEYVTSIYGYLDSLVATYGSGTTDWHTTWTDFAAKTKAYGQAAEAGYAIGNVPPNN